MNFFENPSLLISAISSKPRFTGSARVVFDSQISFFRASRSDLNVVNYFSYILIIVPQLNSSCEMALESGLLEDVGDGSASP